MNISVVSKGIGILNLFSMFVSFCNKLLLEPKQYSDVKNV